MSVDKREGSNVSLSQSSISDLTKGKVVGQSFREDRLVLTFSDNRSVEIDIPAQIVNDKIIQLIRIYLADKFNGSTPDGGTARKWKNALQLLFVALEGRDTWSFRTAFLYLDILKERYVNTEKSIYSVFAIFRNIVRGLADSRFQNKQKLSPSLRRFIRKLAQNRYLPVLSLPPNDPKDSLEIYANGFYNNIQLRNSARKWCIWYLNKKISLRAEFRSKMPEEYAELIGYLSDADIKSCLIKSINPKRKCKLNDKGEQAIDRAYQIIIQASLKLDNPLIIDLVFTMFTGTKTNKAKSGDFYAGYYRNGRTELRNLSRSAIKININRHYRRGKIKNYRRTDLAGHVIEALQGKSLPSPIFLVAPSVEEWSVYAWLLGTDRHQASNISRLRMDSFNFYENSLNTILDINSYKARAGVTEGEVYGHTSPIYKVIKSYLEGIRVGYELGVYEQIPEVGIDAQKQVPHFAKANMRICLGSIKLMFFTVASITNNLTNRAYISEVDDFAFPFVMRTVLSQNIEREQRSRATLDPTRRSVALKQEAYRMICVGHLTQTAVYAKNAEQIGDFNINDGYEPRDIGGDHDPMVDIDSRRQFHKPDTRFYCYILNSKDKIQLAKNAHFGAVVGAEILKAAEAVAWAKARSSESFGCNELHEALGLNVSGKKASANPKQLLEQASMQGYLIESTGLIQKDGQTYILKTPLVSGLIQGFIHHVDSQMETLKDFSSVRVKHIVAHRMFLYLILETFDAVLIREGKELLDQYEFQFPNLLAGL
ncbi:MAG: hypothetical protein JKY50_18805 [Oleispira sp.]|nr:hypothetical protein [Oleispira sp.]MBL4881540.1 hypothetical protein [Oleispira sp.]